MTHFYLSGCSSRLIPPTTNFAKMQDLNRWPFSAILNALTTAPPRTRYVGKTVGETEITEISKLATVCHDQ